MNYIEHSLILVSRVTAYVSISDFTSLIGIPVAIISCAIRLKICVRTTGINQYMSIIKKNKKKHDKIILLAKYELNSIEVFNSNISHDKFSLINNVLKGFDDIKEEIKNCNDK